MTNNNQVTISYERLTLTPRTLENPQTLNRVFRLVECYRDTFAAAPWNELLICPQCNESFGADDEAKLVVKGYSCCDKPLKDYWPREKVLADIKNEVTEKASCWLALAKGSVVGFTWGYAITLRDLEQKLSLATDIPNKVQTVFYQDEIGVRSDFRNKGIGTRLFALRQADAAICGGAIQIARVMAGDAPSVSYLWLKNKLGYSVVARYPEKDNRVILARQIPSALKL